MNELILSYALKSHTNGFGILNFLSGIMVATAVNTITGFCSSQDASIYLLFSGMTSFVSSFCLFRIYSLLLSIKQLIDDEISLYRVQLVRSDLTIQRNFLWKKHIDEKGKRIKIYSVIFIFTIFILTILLWCTWKDTNSKPSSCEELNNYSTTDLKKEADLETVSIVETASDSNTAEAAVDLETGFMENTSSNSMTEVSTDIVIVPSE